MSKIIHIAFIPDGNRRWAKKLGKSLYEAYSTGVKKVRDVIRYLIDKYSIEYITFYVLSVENILNRSKVELKILYKLMKREFRSIRYDPDVHSRRIRIQVIGLRKLLPKDVLKEIEITEKCTKNYNNHVVNLAIAYGTTYEITDLLNKIVEEYSSKNIINPCTSIHSKLTYLGNLPKPNLVIRTGGEYRLSNFLLLNVVNVRFIVLKKYWPEITEEDLDNILNSISIDDEF